MKLRPKIVSYMLIVASVPLVLAMSVALRQSSNQTHALTLDIVQGYLEAGANDLSGFFSARKSEINAYAHSPLLKTMNFQYINPTGESPRFVAIVRDVSERREATRSPASSIAVIWKNLSNASCIVRPEAKHRRSPS